MDTPSNGNGHAPDPAKVLREPHLAELRASGLSDAAILAGGFHTEDHASRIKKLLNWQYSASSLGPSLVIPYHAPDGGPVGYARIKPTTPRAGRGGKLIRYEAPRGHPPRAYFAAGFGATTVTDTTIPLVITEGEKKGAAAQQAGFATVAVSGVWSWCKKQDEDDDGPRELIDDLASITWTGRNVCIVFDSDLATNTKLQWAEYHLAQVLASKGAVVKLVRLPSGPEQADGKPGKVGLDDYLLTHTADDLRALLEAATVPSKPEPDTPLESDTDSHRLARIYRDQCQADGVDAMVFWQGEFFRWDGACYQPVADKEIRAEVTGSVKTEFDRLNVEAQKFQKQQKERQAAETTAEEQDSKKGKKKKQEGAPVTLSVSRHLIGDVTQALTDITLLSDTVQPPSWLVPETDWLPGDILACQNGLLHLPSLIANTDHLIKPTPLFFSRNALDYNFDIGARACQEWLAFVHQLWSMDPEAIATLQEWFGYCLTADTSQQKILLLVGPPRSGKGTIARVLRRLVGEANVCAPTLASLGTNFGLAPMLGKSVAIVPDARLSGRSDAAIVIERLLSISGEDDQTVDRKHLPQVTCKLSTRLVVITNELPRLNDPSGALLGRFIVLRMTNSWLGKEDTTLTAKLLGELPGILLWAIEGWRRLRERGHFLQPASGSTLIQDLGDLSSPIGAFLRECCVVDPGAGVAVQDIFSRWKSWAEEKGWKDGGTEQTFGRNLRAAVPAVDITQPWDKESGKRVRMYTGLRLKTEEEATGKEDDVV